MLRASEEWAMLEGLTPPVRNAGTCKVATVSATLSDDDRKIFLAAVSDKSNWPIKTLAKALNERGLLISDSPLTNHRAQTCVCFRQG
jgi:hypothetical protein